MISVKVQEILLEQKTAEVGVKIIIFVLLDALTRGEFHLRPNRSKEFPVFVMK